MAVLEPDGDVVAAYAEGLDFTLVVPDLAPRL